MIIKRESWSGHFRNVLRNSRGQLVTHAKWTRSFTVSRAAVDYKTRGTLSKSIARIEKTRLVNVTEVNVYNSKVVPGKAEKYQYMIKGTIIHNNKQNVIYAASQMHDKDYPVSKARAEAFDNFHARVSADVFGGDSDAESGKRILMIASKKDQFIEEGIRYYADISS